MISNHTAVLGAGIIVICIALLFIGRLILHVRTSSNSINWPVTRGKIVRSRVRDLGMGFNIAGKYFPDIRYEYTVDGVKYQARRWTYNMSGFKRRSGAEQVASRYPEGAEVGVRYDPGNPKSAILEAGAGRADVKYGGFIGMLMLVAGIVVLAIGLIR